MNPDAQSANPLLDDIDGFEGTLGMPPGQAHRQGAGLSQQKSAAQQQYYQTLQKQSSYNDGDAGYVKVESDMTFDQAKGLIHQHILDLDI